MLKDKRWKYLFRDSFSE